MPSRREEPGAPVASALSATKPQLDLRVPEDAIRGDGLRSDVDEVPARRQVKEALSQAWKPESTNLQEHWASKSKVAELLLGATGALEKPCSAEERRRRERRCFGAQYEGDEY